MSHYRNDQTDRAQSNARMATVATALQGKYALVRAQDSISLIYILSADCLLNPGATRLTAFDIHLTAVVYGPTTRPGTFQITHNYRTFIAYDLVSLFSAPSSFASLPAPSAPMYARGSQSASAPSSITPPVHWLTAMDTLEMRASLPGYGGHEGLPSIFADDTAINTLVRASIQMQMMPTVASAYRPCQSRRESFAITHGGMARRLSSH